jgi:uncharacterized membrane protein YobD (UPF0266 family)
MNILLEIAVLAFLIYVVYEQYKMQMEVYNKKKGE